MEEQDLNGRLIEVLRKMYGMEVFAQLMEFCQGELRVLLWLDEAASEEQRIPSVMASAMNVTKGRITAAIASLKRKGYVVSSTPERDRRKLVVSLTEEGSAYVRQRRKRAVETVSKFVERIGAERANELIETLSISISGEAP